MPYIPKDPEKAMRLFREAYRQLARREKRTRKLLRHIYAILERELLHEEREELPVISF
jgi:hypothetical protein